MLVQRRELEHPPIPCPPLPLPPEPDARTPGDERRCPFIGADWHAAEYGRLYGHCVECKRARRGAGWRAPMALGCECPSCGMAFDLRLVLRTPLLRVLRPGEGPPEPTEPEARARVVEPACPHCGAAVRIWVDPRAPALAAALPDPVPGAGPECEPPAPRKLSY